MDTLGPDTALLRQGGGVLSGHSFHLSLRPTDFTHIGVPAALRSAYSSTAQAAATTTLQY